MYVWASVDQKKKELSTAEMKITKFLKHLASLIKQI